MYCLESNPNRFFTVGNHLLQAVFLPALAWAQDPNLWYLWCRSFWPGDHACLQIWLKDHGLVSLLHCYFLFQDPDASCCSNRVSQIWTQLTVGENLGKCMLIRWLVIINILPLFFVPPVVVNMINKLYCPPIWSVTIEYDIGCNKCPIAKASLIWYWILKLL